MPPEPTPRHRATASTAADRLPPYSENDEACVLGSLMAWPAHLHHVVEGSGGEELFYDLRHAIVYRHLSRLTGNAAHDGEITEAALGQVLNSSGELDRVGGFQMITGLRSAAITRAHAEVVIETVRDASVRRRILAVVSEAGHACYSGHSTASEIGSNLMHDITQTMRGSVNEEVSIEAEAEAFMALCEAGEPPARVPLGFPSIDGVYCPTPGDVVIIAARPSVGKSSLAGCCSVSMALRNPAVGVGIISLEMTNANYFTRMVSQESGIPMRTVADPSTHSRLGRREVERVVNAIARLRASPVWFSPSRGNSIARIEARIRFWVRAHGIKVVFIDYVNRIASPHGMKERHTAVKEISGSLKSLALELGIVIVAIVQINREAGDPTERPRCHHLRESGALEEDADMIILLQRIPMNEMKVGAPPGVYAHIDKARNGATRGGVVLNWHGPTCRFIDPAFGDAQLGDAPPMPQASLPLDDGEPP